MALEDVDDLTHYMQAVARLTAERDAARADADRLAETLRSIRHVLPWGGVSEAKTDRALDLHDAEVAKRTGHD